MRRLVIYIVDADASVRMGLSRVVRSAGLEPRLFESASAFLDAVVDDVPACLLLDVNLSLASALDVQARLRQRSGDYPLIALSARDEESTRDMARELGAQFFLRKPVDDQALLDAIEWVSGTARAPDTAN